MAKAKIMNQRAKNTANKAKKESKIQKGHKHKKRRTGRNAQYSLVKQGQYFAT